MRTDTPSDSPFDVDELFHSADTPSLSVDPGVVLATGQKVRRRRRLAGAAGLTAATLVAALGVSSAAGLLGGPSALDDPAGGTTSSRTSASLDRQPEPAPEAPAAGTSVQLPDIRLPGVDGGRGQDRVFTIDYGVAGPGQDVLGVSSDQGITPVVRVRPGLAMGGAPDVRIAFDDPPRAQDAVMSVGGEEYVVVVAPVGVVSLDLGPGTDVGAVVSDMIHLPGTESEMWVFATDRPIDRDGLRGVLAEDAGRFVHVSPSGASHEVATVHPGGGDPARVYYSRDLDLLGLETGTGTSYSKHPSQAGAGVPGGMASTSGPGQEGEHWLFAVLPEGTTAAAVRGEDGPAVPLQLTELPAEDVVVGYVHESGTAPSGELTATWTGPEGERSSPLG